MRRVAQEKKNEQAAICGGAVLHCPPLELSGPRGLPGASGPSVHLLNRETTHR